MTSAVHRWRFPTGSPDRRAQDAIDDLYARTRPPFARKEIDQPSALAIVRHACRYANCMTAVTQLHIASSEKVATSSPEISGDASEAAYRLRKIVGRLCRYFDNQADMIEDPDFLALPLMASMGSSEQNAAREIAEGLIKGLEAAELLAKESATLRNQVAPSRQNPGEAEKTSAIVELALAWVDLTGRPPPGKAKCQTGPFAKFVATLLGEEERDHSRQIIRAVALLKKGDVELVRNEGYLARWRTGADRAG